MNALIQKLSATIRQATAETAAHVRRQVVLSALMGVFALLALGFGLAALAIYASDIYGPAMGMLVIAAAALVLAALVFVWLKIEKRRAERRRLRRATYASTGATLGSAAAPLLLRSPALLMAAVVGGSAYVAASALLSRFGGQHPDEYEGDGLDPVQARDAVDPRRPNGAYRAPYADGSRETYP